MSKTDIVLPRPGFYRAFFLLFLTFSLCSKTIAATYLIEAVPSDTANIHQILLNHQEKIGNILKIDFKDTVRVVIAYNQEAFNNALGAGFPDWGAAAAVKEKKLIVIKSPDRFPVGKSLKELLGHELGHIMLDSAVKGKWLPRWFEEGFCQLVSGEWRIEQDILITRATWGSGLIPLTALDNVNHFGGAKASLAYAESYLAMSSLVQEFGIEFIPDFSEYYNESNNVYEAFSDATGYRYIEWLGIWQSKTAERYRFILYIFDPSILFPLIAILFILLYLLKKYLTRKKLKQWEFEERYKGDDQSYTTSD